MKSAVIEAKGRQFKIKEGDIICVNRLKEKQGAKVEFTDVLLAQNGKKLILDEESLYKIIVEGKVIVYIRGKKICITKYKSKKGYKRSIGHRQDLTRVEIKKINIGDK